jgi:hypothetical protein
MTILKVEVVVLTINICWNDRSEVSLVFLVITPIQDIKHSLCIGITLVGGMRRSVVNHGLIDGIGGFVWEDAGRETRDHFLHLER